MSSFACNPIPCCSHADGSHHPVTKCPTQCSCSIPSCAVSSLVSATFQATSVVDIQLVPNVDAQVTFSFPLVANPTVFVPFTSIFQAPTTGVYLFNANVTWKSTVVNQSMALSLSVGGQKVLTSTSLSPALGTQTATLTGLLSLTAGQTVVVLVNSSNIATILGGLPRPASLTWFSGTRA